MQPPTLNDLLCLNAWPENTIGYDSEKYVISLLKRLCDAEGYGRIHQLCEQIHSIWRNPEILEKYKQLRKEHLKIFED